MKPLDALCAPLEGVNLIEASAGTGKTYTITILYLRLVLEAMLPVEGILVVTFTKAATQELKGRIRAQLRKALDALEGGPCTDAVLSALVQRVEPGAARARLKAALRDFDMAAVFTIHGFCQRMLSDLAFETRALFDAELIEDQSELLTVFADDFWRTHCSGLPVEFLAGAGQTPETFMRLAARLGPDVAIIPDLAQPDLTGALTDYRDALRAVAAVFDRRTVQHELETAGLRQNMYPLPKIVAWLDEIERTLAGGPAYPVPEAVTRLSPSGLEKAVTKNGRQPQHVCFEACEKALQAGRILDGRCAAYRTWLEIEFIRAYRARFPQIKESRGMLYFDDLLVKLSQALQDEGAEGLKHAIRTLFGAALIDEFQDTDPVQYAIFQTLFPGGPLFLIGDPKQAVYSFRGADIFTYLAAAAGVGEGHAYTLSRNWRSSVGLVAAFNTLFGRHPDAFLSSDIRYLEVEPAPDAPSGPARPLTIWLLPGDGDCLKKPDATAAAIAATVAEIVRLMREEGRAPAEMAVLVRKNDQAAPVREALAAMGIPSVLLSDQSVFESDEAGELEILLTAVVYPHNPEFIRAALGTALLGRTALEIAALDVDGPAWDTLQERFRRYHDLWLASGFMRMLRELLEQEALESRLIRLSRGERRLTNLRHLAELVHLAAREGRLGPVELLQWLSRHRRTPEGAYELRLESDADAVRIVTVHKSKGLEYPIVFCPLAWSSSAKGDPCLFHEGGRRMVDLGSEHIDAHRQAALDEQLAEEMRLLYVAVTRAKERCYLAWGRINDTARSPLAHLFHRGADPQQLGDAELRADIDTLVQGEPHIAVTAPPSLGALPPVAPAPSAALAPRVFTGAIDRTYRISSFTALTSAAPGAEAHDHDTARPSAPAEPAAPSIFTLPRGARTGIMLHALFEQIDFTNPDGIPPVLADLLKAHGFEPVWHDPILAMTRTLLTAPLDASGITLATVPLADRLTELEFHLPLARLTPQGLQQAFLNAAPELPGGFPEHLADLDFETQHGYLRGFIDLVFRSGDRYYLIDWKSNHLGDHVADYHSTALEQEMVRSAYILQYHLYTLALHHYLKQRLPDYDYDRHFGGVFYCFLRGTEPTGAYGIHRARPSLSTIQNLEKTLTYA